jgi:hypothetical protein
MKIKHNKIKNTGLLFELLVRQIASDVLDNIDSKAVGIIQKYFGNTELSKEFLIYKTLSSTRNLSESKAEILISTSLDSFKKLNQGKLRKEKYNLISDIQENFNLDDFFKAKIDNYKALASIYILLESEKSKAHVNPESIVKMKFTILENLTKKKEALPEKDSFLEEFKNSDKDIRTIAFKLAVDKFNEKYQSNINSRQKELIREYINNVTTTTRLKDYVNTNLNSVKKELNSLVEKIDDKTTQIKVRQITEIISNIPKTRNVTDEDILNLFNYYQLVEEITKITNND